MFDPKAWYEGLKYELSNALVEDLHHKVFSILMDHVGFADAIDLEKLSTMVFGGSTEKDLRKTRKIIEELRKLYNVPVMSTAGQSGRWLATGPDELFTEAKRLTEYANTIKETASAMELIAHSMNIDDTPEELHKTLEQLSIWEMHL